MEIGLFVPLAGGNASPELLAALGREAEVRGFESIWVPEHVVLFDDYDSPYPYSPDGKFPGGGDTGLLDPLVALTYLAAVTDRIRLGTSILLVPQRNPVYTAKQVADLDVLSGGRFEFGIGIGWLQEEFEALQVPFERRGTRCDEHLQVMRSLWTEATSEFHGELYDLRPTRMYPKPVQSPHPPIHVGGESRAAMRRVARHGQGWFSWNRLPDQLDEPIAQLDEVLAEHGRSRPEVTITTTPYLHPIGPDEVLAYRERGVDRLVVLCFAFGQDDLVDTLDRLVREVLEPASA